VCWQELYDPARPGDMHRDGLISAGGQPKPSMARLAEIRQAIKEKRSPATLVGAAPAGATGVAVGMGAG
jgi:hypothetical protein